MKPTRQTQPYRQGAREPGAALRAMTRGRSFGGWNPMDVQRAAMLSRPKRPTRAPRPKRPPR